MNITVTGGKSKPTMTVIYEDFANGIIIQAANDYRKVLKILAVNPLDAYSIIEKASIERFFRSQWYSMLTKADGEMILRRLQNGE